MTSLIVILIILAIGAANVPWLSDRFLFFFSPPNDTKLEWMRWVEWLVLYLTVGLIASGIENYAMGGRHEQGWEFVVVTLCLFLVAAMPGFIYRHMLQRHT